MTTTHERERQSLLVSALIGPLHLAAIHAVIQSLNPNASNPELQHIVIEAIRSLVDDGLVVTGYPGSDEEFIAEPLAEAMANIESYYIGHFDEPADWMWAAWIDLTEDGKAVILETEEGRRVQAHESERQAANAKADGQPGNRAREG